MKHGPYTSASNQAASRTLLWGSIIVSIVLVLHALSIFNWYVDDAFIPHVYARTLASDGVFAYSHADPSNFGVSDPLWVFVLAPAHLLGINAYIYEKVLLILIAIATVAWIQRRLTRLFRNQFLFPSLFFLYPGMILASSWNYSIWIVGGLETVFYAGVVGIGALDLVYRLSRKSSAWKSAIYFGISSWLRPDGVLLLALAAIAYTVVVLKIYPRSEKARAIVVFVLVGFSIAMLNAILMYALTGSILPSTFYIKAGHFTLQRLSDGFDYVAAFTRQTGYFFPGIVLASPIAGIVRRRQLPREVLICVFTFTVLVGGYTIGFIVAVGGDWMLGSRFFVHIYPAMAILATICLFIILNWTNSIYAKGLVWMSLAILPISLFVREIQPAGFASINADPEFSILSERVWLRPPRSVPGYPKKSYELAAMLNGLCEGGERLAMTEGGFFAYYTHCRAFDLHGWSIMKLAMIRYRTGQWASPEFVEEVLAEAPDFVLISGYRSEGSSLTYRLPIEKALMTSAMFLENYKLMGEFDNIDEIYRYPYDLESGALLRYFLFGRSR